MKTKTIILSFLTDSPTRVPQALEKNTNKPKPAQIPSWNFVESKKLMNILNFHSFLSDHRIPREGSPWVGGKID